MHVSNVSRRRRTVEVVRVAMHPPAGCLHRVGRVSPWWRARDWQRLMGALPYQREIDGLP